jgi:hypothetical protein
MYSASELLLANFVLEKALRITGHTLGNVQLVDWRFGYLEIVAQRGFGPEFLNCFRRVKTGDGCACGRAFLSRDTVVIEDVSKDYQFAHFRDVAERAGVKSVQSTPLISSSSALLGVLSTHGSYVPSPKQLEEIKLLARQTADQLVRCASSLWPLARARLQKPQPGPVANSATHKSIYRPENLGAEIAEGAARMREIAAKAISLLKEPVPDTFLGRQHHNLFSSLKARRD